MRSSFDDAEGAVDADDAVLLDARLAGDLARRLEGGHEPPDDRRLEPLQRRRVGAVPHRGRPLRAAQPRRRATRRRCGSSQNLWYAEAGANGAFPLDDRSALEILLTPRPVLSPPRNRYVYFPDTAEVPESQAVNVRNRSFAIGALVDIPAPGAEGVLFAHGSLFGGHALYVKDNRLHYVYNFVGMIEQKVVATEDLPTGENLILSASFDKDGEDPPGVADRDALALARRQEGRRGADQDPARQVHDRRRGALHRARRRLRRHRRLPRRPSRGASRAARSTASPSTSAASRTSTSSARPHAMLMRE